MYRHIFDVRLSNAITSNNEECCTETTQLKFHVMCEAIEEYSINLILISVVRKQAMLLTAHKVNPKLFFLIFSANVAIVNDCMVQQYDINCKYFPRLILFISCPHNCQIHNPSNHQILEKKSSKSNRQERSWKS